MSEANFTGPFWIEWREGKLEPGPRGTVFDAENRFTGLKCDAGLGPLAPFKVALAEKAMQALNLQAELVAALRGAVDALDSPDPADRADARFMMQLVLGKVK